MGPAARAALSRRGLRVGLAVWVGAVAAGSTGAASARVPCAEEGPPIYPDEEGYAPAKQGAVEPSASVTIGAAWGGAHAERRAGDPAGAGFAVELWRARLGVCGQHDRLAYRAQWEPWDVIERARPDATPWGRLVEAQVAWLPYDWAVATVGVGKVPFSRGREQPAGALALAALPYATRSIAPDRRFGLAGDVDLGAFRLAAGVFEGTRLAALDPSNGLLLAGRAAFEPIGPVARGTWPAFGAWTDRPRASAGVSGAYHLRVDGGEGFALAADLAFAWRRLALGGEFLYAQAWALERPSASPGLLADRVGGWLEALAVVWRPYLSLAARGEYLDEDFGAPEPRRRAAGGRDRFFAVGGGVNLHLLGPAIRVQIAYTHKFHLTGALDDGALLALVTVGR